MSVAAQQVCVPSLHESGQNPVEGEGLKVLEQKGFEDHKFSQNIGLLGAL